MSKAQLNQYTQANQYTYQKTDFKQLSRDFSDLMDTSRLSTKIKRLTLQEKERDVDIRPSFHSFLRGPIGSVKSSALNEVSTITKIPVVTNITRAGLVGTIDKQTQQYIAGYAWEIRNNVGLFDEFSFGKKREGQNEFLQLLESGTYHKRFGLYSGETNIEDGNFYFHVNKGQIDLKTGFSAIMASMKKLEWERGQYFKALMSRCNPYNYNPDVEALHKIAEGQHVYVPKTVNVPSEIVISSKTYSKILEYVHSQIKLISPLEDEIASELYLRSIGDVCRSYAVWNNLDRMKDIVRWKIETHFLVGKYFKGNKGLLS